MKTRTALAACCLVVAVVTAGCAAPVATSAASPAGTAASKSTTSTGGVCAVLDGRADTTCTPGALNPEVTQATITSTICRSGWTKTIRPPASDTSRLKDEQKMRYGEAGVANADLEEDHAVPLELGGAPRDHANLWPEPRTGPRGAATKDAEENLLHTRVCAGQESLAAAQAQILTDWTHS